MAKQSKIERVWTVQSPVGGVSAYWSTAEKALAHCDWMHRNWGNPHVGYLNCDDTYFVRSHLLSEIPESEHWRIDRHWYHPGHADLDRGGWDTCSCADIR